MPVPGDGNYEWDGYFDMDVLPEEYKPERGFSGTANAMSLPNDYPIERYKVVSSGRRPGATNGFGSLTRQSLIAWKISRFAAGLSMGASLPCTGSATGHRHQPKTGGPFGVDHLWSDSCRGAMECLYYRHRPCTVTSDRGRTIAFWVFVHANR